MNRTSTAIALAAAFIGGFVVARSLPEADAASGDPPAAPRIVNLLDMKDDELGGIRPNTEMRSKFFFEADGATVAVQTGNVAKHFHANANELQYIIEGSGTFWLGDKEQQIRAGDLIIIPKGTNHAGSKATTGRYKALSIKTPPQAADDVHPVP